MKAICFNFEIHQPFRLKRYRFFDIGKDHWYFDDFLNDDIVTRVAHNSTGIYSRYRHKYQAVSDCPLIPLNTF